MGAEILEPAMSDYDIRRIEAVFQGAADLPKDERGSFLEQECGEDLELRTHVERLLKRLESEESLVSPGVPSGPFPGAVITEGPGAEIGRYKLLQVIGQGGFGVVYMAEQQKPVVRKVALKIIKLGMDTKEVVARFEAERQALALMDHPNIAKVLDGGATGSGRPFFVMELVRGVAITEYADSRLLGTADRLDLFVQVCHAVQHAHQKGVIHRDLKPSNVLVTLQDGRPMPKVIDFGVAKAMHGRLTDKTLFTRYEQFIGTPAYMSPEQSEMSALDVDTRTDIYALGVLLYELFTGTTPFYSEDNAAVGIVEIQRRIREDQPQRPSIRISTDGDGSVAQHRGVDIPALRRRLSGDLDWIVMKALEKDPARRYGTATEFAQDIRRHQESEPVLAGPPGAAYRIRKLLARHRKAVISMTLIGLALLVGIIGITIKKIEADRNATLAVRQAGHALAALDFLVSTLSLTNPRISLDPDVSVRALLDHTSAAVAEVFAEQPWAEARVRAAIGRAYAALSEPELAEAHLRRAAELVDVLRQVGGDEDELQIPSIDGGEHYSILWTLTNVCFNLERGDAFAVSQRARTVGLNFVAERFPELAAILLEFTRQVENGAWSVDDDAMDGVTDLFDRSVAMSEREVAFGDLLWPIVADTFLAAGYMVWYTPHEPYSEAFFRHALTIQQRELEPDHPDIGNSVHLLVGILNKKGEQVAAEELIRSSVEALRRVHREGSLPIASAESTLGENLVFQGRYSEAEPILLRSHKVLMERIQDESSWMVVESIMRIVGLYESWRPAKAIPYKDSLAATCAAGKYTVQWAIAGKSYLPEHEELVEILSAIKEKCGGVSFLAAGGSKRPEGLMARLDDLVTTRPLCLSADDPRMVGTARLLLGWANSLDPETHSAERQRMAEEAVSLIRDSGRIQPIAEAEGLAMLADGALIQGRKEDARRLAEKAWGVIGQNHSTGTWFAAAVEVRIARTLLESKRFSESESLLCPAEKVLSAQLGPNHADALYARQLLFDLYTAWGRLEDAQLYETKEK